MGSSLLMGFDSADKGHTQQRGWMCKGVGLGPRPCVWNYWEHLPHFPETGYKNLPLEILFLYL